MRGTRLLRTSLMIALEALLAQSDTGLAQGRFREAGIGTGSRYQIQEKIRGDHIWWLSPDEVATTPDIFLQLDQLKDHLNRKLYLGLFDFESHLARYKPGSGYERHYDRPKGSARRKLTVTLYLGLVDRVRGLLTAIFAT